MTQRAKQYGETGSAIQELFDEVIDTIPESLSVLDCMVGLYWTLIRSEIGIGMAKTLTGGEPAEELRNIRGMPLKKLASYIKSPNLIQASLGMAAINSALNHLTYVDNISEPDAPKAFDQFFSGVTGKKVATVGYFPMLEPLGEICEFKVIAKDPLAGQYSEAMSEHILPDQDLVFITGTTFLYKTALKFIESASKARIVLVGASVPLSPVLLRYGVDTLAGVVVTNEQVLWQAISEGGKKNVLADCTQTVCLQR